QGPMESRRESINPWILTGFTDAEGSFMLRIRNTNNRSVGYYTSLVFEITLHNKDKSILENIQSTWKVGTINNRGDGTARLSVTRFEDLKVIIDHFEKYPLITQKLGDYKLFKQAFSVMENKEHLKENGIKELVRIKAKMNWGLNDELKKAFPENISKERPLINKNIPNLKWLAGFTSGEGTFYVHLAKSEASGKVYVRLRFIIGQHIRDKNLMNSLITYLGCGTIQEKNRSKGSMLHFIVTKFSDINDKIIPVFQENTLIGVKLEDFEDWCKVAKLIEEKKHLTESGLDEIKKIKLNMNKGRVF
uniref:I-OnuI_e-hCCR5 n=1 Tax=synthetic construct TaxID=32630 RepID=UPI000A1C7A41|nr:Chain A, I-OnuI_e-hCCR5 [synthetic construct]5THG_D Chain D, I-OnuI_e-hCCR5 [synthetic construct]